METKQTAREVIYDLIVNYYNDNIHEAEDENDEDTQKFWDEYEEIMELVKDGL